MTVVAEPDSPLIASVQGIGAALAFTVLVACAIERRSERQRDQLLPQKRYSAYALLSIANAFVISYLLPVSYSTWGVIPYESALYEWSNQILLPALLVVYLARARIPSLKNHWEYRAFLVFLSGVAGVCVACVACYWAFLTDISTAKTTMGCLAASWIGGSPNLVAARDALEPLGSDDNGQAIAVDALAMAFWLWALTAAMGLAPVLNRLIRVSPEEPQRRAPPTESAAGGRRHDLLRGLFLLLLLGFGSAWVLDAIAAELPEAPPFLTRPTWRVLLVSVLGLVLSQTRFRGLAESNAVKSLSNLAMYFFIATLGAQASFLSLADHGPRIVLVAFICLLIHGLSCLVAARVCRVDIETAAVASIAAIGGFATVPVVAKFSRNADALIPMGLLMALVGYQVAHFIGWGVGQLCNWI